MKKFLCFIVVLCLIIQGNIIAVQAAPTVKKTSIVSVKQVGKQSIKIGWKRVSGAKGYVLQYKKSGEQWKKKNTTKTSGTVSGLEKGMTYQFRVCAYKNVNGVKKYGKYSVIKKKAVQDYIYLVGLYTPYNSSYYEAYSAGKYFMMGGVQQKNSFILGQDHWGVEKNANFNIKGKYSKLTFDVGKVDGASDHPYDGDFDVSVYADGILVKTISVQVDGLPITVEIPLENVERLTFEAEEEACTLVGFSNVKLFY